MENISTIIISALVGAVVSFIGAVIKNVLDMRSKINESLRDSRISVYKALWKHTELLPEWPRATDVTYEKLSELSKCLRDWYFSEGGIYLSKQSREAYGDLQRKLDGVVKQNSSGKVSDIDYEVIRGLCHDLRTELTKDLVSRRRGY